MCWPGGSVNLGTGHHIAKVYRATQEFCIDIGENNRAV